MRHFCLTAGFVILLGAAGPASALPEDKIRVHFIDVGQGAATLVEFACGAILIDTGGERWPADESRLARYDSNIALYAYLNWFFNQRPDLGRRLDALFITHPHKDHTRGVPIVLEEFRPRNIIHNGQGSGSGIHEQNLARDYAREHKESGVKVWYVLEHLATPDNGLTNGIIDPLECSGTDPEIRVLWGQVLDSTGWEAHHYYNENNHSLVIRIDFKGASILFMGDLEEDGSGGKAGIERLIEKYNGQKWLDADVLHVGHHGSRNGNSKTLTQRVSPEIAVISSGPACRRPDYSAWSHAHPRKETLDELFPSITKSRDAEVTISYFDQHEVPPTTLKITKALYGTGWDGTIVLESGPNGPWREVKDEVGPDLCIR